MDNRKKWNSRLIPVIIAGIFVLGCFESCTNSSENSSVASKTKEKTEKSVRQELDSVKKKISHPIRIENGFRILSLQKVIEENSTKTNEYCENWNLDTLKIRKLILGMSFITSEHHHHAYLVSGCNYYGKLCIGNDTLKFEVNAGSYMYLFNSDTSFILADTAGKYRNYFLYGKTSAKGD